MMNIIMIKTKIQIKNMNLKKIKNYVKKIL